GRLAGRCMPPPPRLPKLPIFGREKLPPPVGRFTPPIAGRFVGLDGCAMPPGRLIPPPERPMPPPAPAPPALPPPPPPAPPRPPPRAPPAGPSAATPWLSLRFRKRRDDQQRREKNNSR